MNVIEVINKKKETERERDEERCSGHGFVM
jgi:hypothetical protein